jgi:hypothetical protein
MKFFFLLSAIFTLRGVHGSPVGGPACYALAKLSIDLNSTAIYFRNLVVI